MLSHTHNNVTNKLTWFEFSNLQPHFSSEIVSLNSNLFDFSDSYFSIKNFLCLFVDSQNDFDKGIFNFQYQEVLNYYTYTYANNTYNTAFLFDLINSWGKHILIPNVNVLSELDPVIQYLFINLKSKTSITYAEENWRFIYPSFQDNLEMFEVLSYDVDGSLYNTLSTPNVKLYYPEPFIATPSFAHEDIWVLNVLQYQHWLWFFFISLIMFYFITFINVVRWCNLRNKPKRETRGVSRSKCADLITACVPVSWAASIIITESVDATDYYDGFGTGELVIGIRAYQWGWEYFYPKGLDLNYTINPNYNSFTGNSLKYVNSSSKTLESNMLWKYYQLNDITSTSSVLTNSLLNNTNLLNYSNFNNHSINTLETSNAFKKIQFFSKSSSQNLFYPTINFNTQYQKLTNLYYNDTNLTKSTSYGTIRQHNFLSNMSNKNSINTNLDYNGTKKFFNYIYFNKNNTSYVNTLKLNLVDNSFFYNKFLTYKTLFSFVDSKSVNKTLLPSERSMRFVNNLNLSTKNNVTLPITHNPVPNIKNFNYDASFGQQYTPLLLQSKEEAAPNFIFDTYWLSNFNYNKNNVFNFNNFLNYTTNNYLPSITEYSEYDFKNWQVLELVEDSAWEASYLSQSHNDYINIFMNINSKNIFNTQDSIFNNVIRNFKFNLNRQLKTSNNLISLPILSDDFVPTFSLINLKDFQLFQFENIIDNIDDVYNNLKLTNYLLSSNYLNLLNTNIWANIATSYVNVFNNFTVLGDDNLWSLNSSNSINLSNISLNNLNSNDYRLNNSLKLRSTAKNSIITYNAIQKVFKSRFDDGRSNARLSDISNSFNSFSFLNGKRVPYETLLGKNYNNYFTTQNYFIDFKTNFNLIHSLLNNLNIYFLNLPFLVSTQSDPARYLWFDWQSRWSSLEVQPSSIARYSLVGVPYTNKSFEYATSTGDEINDSENYLIRLGHSRKNYMTTWTYSPILYTRLLNWYKENNGSNLLFNSNSVTNLKILLLLLQHSNLKSISTVSLPTYSMFNTPGREAVQSLSAHNGFESNVSILSDILTKREYLYQKFFLNKTNSSQLPTWAISSPTNSLLLEVKKTFTLVDPTTFASEISRNFFYNSTNLFQINLLNSFITNSNFSYFTSMNNNFTLNTELYKNQYRPMKKGITNMIRLQATGAIALPIELRIHILASSKDVIHSWAIPSAGIKIDCVPGYSSHRVTIILASGIYWGQCMEICGRFHHWMPIVVFFLKKDLFFLWATNFMIRKKYTTLLPKASI